MNDDDQTPRMPMIDMTVEQHEARITYLTGVLERGTDPLSTALIREALPDHRDGSSAPGCPGPS